MKKLVTSLAMLLLTAVVVCAEPISREQARQKAESFLKQKNDQRRLVPVADGQRLSRQRRAAANQSTEYYVFNKGAREGFVIVSGDDQTVDILGYTDNGAFDYDQLPPQLQDLLENYTRQIQAIQAGAPVHKLPSNHPKVEQFMTCKWSQGDPYNLLCPLDGGNRSVTGCVATAMAQILYYNREKSVTGTTAAIPGYATWTKGIAVQGIDAGAPIDWDNMKDTYGSASELQKKAVAQLMLYCGVAVHMDYTSGSSGAQISEVADACKNYFGYGNSVRFINSVGSEDEWDKLVYAELAAGRPVYLGGYNAEAGHAFLTCGYENLRYYINWGWGGQSDGYYYLTNLTPGDGQGIGGSADGYNSGKTCIIGLEPENFGEKAMSFTDAAVKKICVTKWDADGDGKLTYNEAAAVTTIGDAFKDNATIKKFPELYYFTSVTSLPDDAFNGCVNLNTLRLPKSLKSIGARALKDCKKLPQINLPTGINAIGEEAFAGCVLLESFELSNEITTIEKRTFKNCAQITEVDLPIGIGSIGDEAFAGCAHLGSVTINTYHPEKIHMGASVFDNVNLSKTILHVMQGTKSFFETTDQWKDFGKIVQTRDISGGQFSTLEAGKTYYIYNVGTGRYLTKGEAYKTQAVAGTDPMRFKAIHLANKPEGVVYFSSPDTGKDGHFLFRTDNDGNVGKGVKACFVDGTSLTNAYWNIQQVDDMIYTIQIPSSETNYVEGEFLGVQTDHKSDAATPTYGTYYDVEYATHKMNCQWQFVLYDENVTERFNEAQTLEKLISTAKKRNIKCDEEQAVYDNLESTIDEIAVAQSSLRKKLKFVEFYHKGVREKCIEFFDSDTDGELSYKEASEVTDFGWFFYFKDDKTLTKVEELQYFTHATAIHGNFMQDCINLETVVLPEGLEKIYYWAFKGCKKLKAINIPEYVNQIGEEAFAGCTALREVKVFNPNPAGIELGTDAFLNVPLSQCTLYVPFGSKTLYEQANVWKNFGKIVEVRGSHVQPAFSAITTDKPGYIYNIGTRMMLTMGEAYGTQSVVAHKGRLYQWKHSTGMGDSVYYLMDNSSSKVVFRTSSDKKVGEGVKTCFGDGTLSAKAYWKVSSVAPNIYTLQVPANDATYVEGDYLGINENHQSAAASPTHGLYWDVKGIGGNSQWAFVTEDDYKAAQAIDDIVAKLKKNLATAKASDVDVANEQAVYDNPQSTFNELNDALTSVRSKLHFITFEDAKAQAICLENWDTSLDGELTFEEAAAVTDIGNVFNNVAGMTSLEVLRYFTGLTEIPTYAFRNAFGLKKVYVPTGVKTIGEFAFTGCSDLKYLVILNSDTMVPQQLLGLPTKGTTLFVPSSVYGTYSTDSAWLARCRISEYTGHPVVTAEATRQYSYTKADITMRVTGAPVDGEASFACSEISDASIPVGTYTISVERGSITNSDVELHDGVLTIEPVAIRVTAKSYTRNVGEENPNFEVTYNRFRNRENASVLTKQPVISCEATADSPAGVYPITVSGAEAQNYVFNYVDGELTVVDPTGIEAPRSGGGQAVLYDLQGRRVTQPQRGLYIREGHKVVVR